MFPSERLAPSNDIIDLDIVSYREVRQWTFRKLIQRRWQDPSSMLGPNGLKGQRFLSSHALPDNLAPISQEKRKVLTR